MISLDSVFPRHDTLDHSSAQSGLGRDRPRTGGRRRRHAPEPQALARLPAAAGCAGAAGAGGAGRDGAAALPRGRQDRGRPREPHGPAAPGAAGALGAAAGRVRAPGVLPQGARAVRAHAQAAGAALQSVRRQSQRQVARGGQAAAPRAVLRTRLRGSVLAAEPRDGRAEQRAAVWTALGRVPAAAFHRGYQTEEAVPEPGQGEPTAVQARGYQRAHQEVSKDQHPGLRVEGVRSLPEVLGHLVPGGVHDRHGDPLPAGLRDVVLYDAASLLQYLLDLDALAFHARRHCAVHITEPADQPLREPYP
ncbi:unnamed protein product [Phytophthora fragariaefolia]|uniref:Unnamed protein product n=1 Tax=Phytophthora fragariaefolia TaxID=1490495 RepID=A0A9W6XPD1_9STRA|nr:unnamed protein product [Phytophthora fragariaefolia]